MDLSRVSIGIKTFLRDDKLFNTIAAIGRTMPEVTMIIADCGEFTEEKNGIYSDLQREGHIVSYMPFDAGFGAMSNVIADLVQTPYLLIGSDDFDFNPPSARQGIEWLAQVLDQTYSLDVVSGRVRGPYEFYLREFVHDNSVWEYPVTIPLDKHEIAPWYVECDLTVNYSLIRREVFRYVEWDSDVKIGGGEHGAFFVDLKRRGYKVAYVPGVQIGEQEGRDSERYKQFRSRASNPARPCFDRRGIRKYVLGSGKVDYSR